MRYEIEGQLLTNIGDAIRNKTGKSALITPENMPSEIESISGEGAVLEPITITENGTTTPPTGVDGFNSVTVDVPSAGSIEPITITENGTFSPPSGVDGYAPIKVNVSGGAEKEYVFNFGTVPGYTPVNIYDGAQSTDISYNGDMTAHILGRAYYRRFLGFLIDLTDVQSVDFVCSFAASDATIGVIASQTTDDVINNHSGAISVFSSYTASPPTARVCALSLDTSSLSGQYYVGILGYEERWASDLAQMWINR